MKLDGVILNESDKLQIIQEIPDESKTLIESITPFKGHSMFEINCTQAK